MEGETNIGTAAIGIGIGIDRSLEGEGIIGRATIGIGIGIGIGS